jgi:hypothetical protein
MKINTKLLTKMKPCQHRLDNWNKHYSTFNGSISKFLDLKEISHSDKIWVSMRLLPRLEVEIFAIDMAVSAQISAYAAYANAAANAVTYATAAAAAAAAYADAAAYAAAAYADAAAYAAAYADAAAYAADVRKKEQESQIEVLKYLFQELK